MIVTFLVLLMIMIGYFLILYSAVAYLGNKKFYKSAPKEVYAVIPENMKERFPGAHIVGWILFTIGFLFFLGGFLFGIWDGIQNHFAFFDFVLRFFILLYGMEIYDIVFFDWILLCHSNFYPHYCPECKDVVGPHLFGFNKKTHMVHFLVYIPICLILAWICNVFV